MPESEEELKTLLMKVKEESEKAGLKLSIPSAVGLQWRIKKSKERRSKKIAELGVRCSH